MTTPTPARTVGFIGLGIMGRGMAASLLRAGYGVVVHNRSRDAEAALADAGARRAATPAELGGMAQVAMLCLSDTAAVEAVLFGPQGLATTLPPGSHVIDTSTIAASATRDHARRLAERGVALLDAPVSGGQQAAEQGTLSCMVGATQPAFEACLPILQGIASRVVHVGGNGAGQVAKACNQVAVSAVMLGVAEAFSLARTHGVDPAAVREALLGGAARSAILEKNALRLLQGDFQPGFRAGLMRKDLRLALDAARDAGACLPVAATTLQWLEALCNTGRADLDWSAVGQLIAELARPAGSQPSSAA